MDTTHINELMAQMRATASRLEALRSPVRSEADHQGADFKAQLAAAVDTVSEAQKGAAASAAAVERGDPNTDLTQVMVQLQKADLSFRAMTEVRNKLVSAYQEIMNLPV